MNRSSQQLLVRLRRMAGTALARFDESWPSQPALARRQLWQPVAIALGLLLLYLYTSPSGIALEDDGFFVLTAKAFGIAHAPGYPLYTLLAGPFQFLPVGSLAWRIHAFSAVCGALTGATLWLILRRLSFGALPALTGAVAFGLSLTFWSQSIIAEVYSLNALLYALALWLLLRANGRGGGRAKLDLRLAVLVIGLSLSNHWPLAVLGSPALLVLLWPLRRAMRIDAPAIIGCLVLGLSPYLWMIWRSHHPAVFTFAEPFDGLSAFWTYINRSNYQGVDHSPTATWLDKLGYLRLVLSQSLLQFAWLGGAIALLGLFRQPGFWPLSFRVGLIGTYLTSSVLIALLLGFDDQPLQRSVFRVYPLIAWLVVAIWMAAGIAWLRLRAPRVGLVIALACMVMPLGLHWSSNDRHADQWGEDYARAVLADLPEDATLYLKGDIPLGTVAYTHHVLGARPDVQLISVSGDLLSDPAFLADSQDGDDRATDRATRLRRHVFDDPKPAVVLDSGSEVTLPRQRTWLWYRLLRSNEQGLPRYRWPPGQRAAFGSLLSDDHVTDPWTRLARQGLMLDYAGFITVASMDKTFVETNTDIEQLLKLAERGFHGRLSRAESLMLTPTPDAIDQARRLLLDAASESDADIGKRDWSRYYNALANLLLHQARQQEAIAWLERSVQVWPDPENRAVATLRQYYRATGDQHGLEGLRQALPAIPSPPSSKIKRD